ncbi:hypothetical protein ACOYR1_17925 [Thalassotalea piscium]
MKKQMLLAVGVLSTLVTSPVFSSSAEGNSVPKHIQKVFVGFVPANNEVERSYGRENNFLGLIKNAIKYVKP